MGFLYSHFLLIFSSIFFISSLHVRSMHPYVANTYQGPSDVVYHMGPVLASPINLFIIWYGDWNVAHQAIIRDFLLSLSSTSTPSQTPFPSVADWWRTVQLYTDQTGTNVTAHFILSGEKYDSYSHGTYLTRLAIQSIIKTAVSTSSRPLPLDPYNGLFLVLTAHDVQVQDFCRAVCGFHYFTFPLIVGATVPYAWIGHSGTQCPGMCAYPFARDRDGPPTKVLIPPNGDIGTDGMVSVIAHELAEMATNPLINAWYAGDDPSAPTEIADLCVGVYGSGAGGGFVGLVYKGPHGTSYNLHGVKGRKFMVQWVWNPARNRCFGPNSLD